MRRGWIAVAAASAVVLLGAGACGPGNNFRDLEGIPSVDPDYAVVVNNVDQHPNIVFLCAEGLGWATTTRDYNALMRVPERDAFCLTMGKPGEHGKAHP